MRSLKFWEKIASSSVWMVAGHAAKLISQAVFFILFARSVGAESFGQFSGILALVVILTPFFGFGAGSLIVKQCSVVGGLVRDYFGNALLLGVLSIVVVFPIILLCVHFAFSGAGSISLLVVVFLADFIFAKFSEICCQVYQSQGRMKVVALLIIQSACIKLIVLSILYLFFSVGELESWLWAHMISAALAMVIPFVVTVKRFGFPLLRVRWDEVVEGLYFSLGISSQGVYNDADKALMLRYDSALNSGNYAAAYKIIDIAFAPIRALLTVTYPKFFSAGRVGIESSYNFALSVMPATLLLGAVGTAVILISASFVQPLLGDSYSQARNILLFLSVIPILRAIHFVLADCITGAGYQRSRSLVQIIFASLNIALNAYLIPNYSWGGAVFASLVCDIGLCIIFYAMIKRRIYSVGKLS